MAKSTIKKSNSQEKMDISTEKATTPKPVVKKTSKVAPSKMILGRSGTTSG